jgi:CheY-like chemotaxis protein
MSMALDTECQAPVIPRELLFVEDETVARKALTRLLTAQGYQVIEAATGDSAILRANKGRVGVVIMDIKLDGNFDGIELAREIHSLHTFTSFIFVSAYAHESMYHDRVRDLGIRVGGWIDKPIDQPKVQDLYLLIDREQRRLQLLARLDHARQRSLEPFSYLQALADEALVSEDILTDVVAELRSATPEPSAPKPIEGIYPPARSEETDMQDVAVQIDAVFDQMQALVEERADHLDLPALLHPLEEQLEALEEKEARLIERNYRKHFYFDPEEGRHLMDKIERLLGKR